MDLLNERVKNMETFVGIIVFILIFCVIYKNCKDKDNTLIKEQLYEQQLKVHASVINQNELPISVTSQLLQNENVYYFSFLVLKDEGGCCGSSSRGDYWIALTNKRILYRTKVKEDNNTKLVERNGVIPFEKVSGIEIVYNEENLGCGGNSQYHELHIGNSGKLIVIPLPTEQKGFEIRKIYMEVLEIIKSESKDEDNQ